MSSRIRMVSIAALAVIGLSAYAADPTFSEVHLNSGEIVTGEIIKQEGDSVALRIQLRMKSGKVMAAEKSYLKTSIARIVEKPPAKDEYAKRIEGMSKTADGNYQMALWCRENNLTDKAIEHLKQAIVLDKANEDVRKTLESEGYTEVEGEWFNDKELLAKKGLVKVGGKLMTPVEAEDFKKKNQKLLARNNAKKSLEDCVGSFKKVTTDLSTAQTKLNTANSQLSSAESAISSAKSRVDSANSQVSSAEGSYRAAQKAYSDEQAANARAPSTPNGPANNSNSAKTAMYSAETSLSTAKKARDAAQRGLDAVERKVMPAKQEVTKWKRTLTELESKREKLRASEIELKTKLGEAEKEFAAEQQATPPTK